MDPNQTTDSAASAKTPCSAIPDASLKLRALMEALDIQEIDRFIAEGQIGDYGNLGRAYATGWRALAEGNRLMGAINRPNTPAPPPR